MINRLVKFFRSTQQLAFKGAGGDRRWERFKASDSLNAMAFAGGAALRNRARQFARPAGGVGWIL